MAANLGTIKGRILVQFDDCEGVELGSFEIPVQVKAEAVPGGMTLSLMSGHDSIGAAIAAALRDAGSALAETTGSAV
jgi:hypothetical protein